MFKIEAYIANIILANADRYIKNFKKQDARVSLWEGDATFHNIELNVDALNEELHSPFVIISGYIHKLSIHVPWTKLLSEPVTITVKTIECVMRLKSKHEKSSSNNEKNARRKNHLEIPKADEHSLEEATNYASYSSTLTNKILSNLSIRCENVIMKIVEEDIVLSMNIEKLTFDNVNNRWQQTMTDVNAESPFSRKSIILTGVTVCLDRLNSSGRIETYLEPLLYRCSIEVRFLRCYNPPSFKKSTYNHMDIRSDKLPFTISEPQMPMLLELIARLFGVNQPNSSNFVESSSPLAPNFSLDSKIEKELEGRADESSWGNWLWSMVPSILSTEKTEEAGDNDLNPINHIGFCITEIDFNIKICNEKVGKTTKEKFSNLLEGQLHGCFYRSLLKNSDWFNTQCGVSHIQIRIPKEKSGFTPIISSGVLDSISFSHETLFDENFDFFPVMLYQELTTDSLFEVDIESQQFQGPVFDFQHSIRFDMKKHLKVFTENFLLEKTPLFAFDYIKIFNSDGSPDQTYVSGVYQNSENDAGNDRIQDQKDPDIVSDNRIALIRLVFGSLDLKITQEFLNIFLYLHEKFSRLQSNASSIGSDFRIRNLPLNSSNVCTIRVTLFDLNLQFLVSAYTNLCLIAKPFPLLDLLESNVYSSSHCVLNVFFKCLDGEMTFITDRKNISVKTANMVCSILQSGTQYDVMKCEKLDVECMLAFHKHISDFRINFKKVNLESSKSHLLLTYYILKYFFCVIWSPSQLYSYYEKIFSSSLIEDSCLKNNSVLEITLETIFLSYQTGVNTFAIRLQLGEIKALVRRKIYELTKRITILEICGNGIEQYVVQSMLQHCENCSGECRYPSIFRFICKTLRLHLDLDFYSWLMYEPMQNKMQRAPQKFTKNAAENTLLKNTAYRKASEGSSGSHSRKCAMVFPKPKESVHSSGEPGTHSPPEVTVTEPLDFYQNINVTQVTEKAKQSFLDMILGRSDMWHKYIVHIDVSDIVVFIPNFRTEFCEMHNGLYTMEQVLTESLQRNCPSNNAVGILVFTLNSIKVKCDYSTLLTFEEFGTNVLTSIFMESWHPDKSTSPWTISINDASLSSLTDEIPHLMILKPFSTSCTMSVSNKVDNQNDLVTNFCVHLDFQPIFVELTARQILLLTKAVETWRFLKCNLAKKNLDYEKVPRVPSNISPDTKVTERGIRKLSGWVQCTFAKCSVNIYLDQVDTGLSKMCLEAEDSIISLEFDHVFHKLKIKLTSFGIYHHERQSAGGEWQSGPFCGALLQRCYSLPLNLPRGSEEDADEKVVLVTITRARSNHLSSRLSSTPSQTEIPISTFNNHYVTEIILDTFSIDLILPIDVLSKYLRVLEPIMNIWKDFTCDTLSVRRESESNRIPASFPLLYINIPILRLFIPISNNNSLVPKYCDTLFCEIQKISVDCHPKNPIIRKQNNLKFSFFSSTRKYTSAEQKLLSQQYQFFTSSISVEIGMWSEIERMIFKEQFLVKEPPSAFEQNPAVMWNRGYQPFQKQTNLKFIFPLISNFSCHIQLAPAVENFSIGTIVQAPLLEVNILSRVDVILSTWQISFLLALYKEYICQIHPLVINRHEKSGEASLVHSENLCKDNRTVDSGVESIELNSVCSSTFQKSQTEVLSNYMSNPETGNISNTKIKNEYQYSVVPSIKKLKIEWYVTAPEVQVIFRQFDNFENDELNEEKLSPTYSFHYQIHQPAVLYVYESGYPSLRLEIYSMSFNLDCEKKTLSLPIHLPVTVFKTLKHKRDSYSSIIESCVTLQILRHINDKIKLECLFGQPVSVILNSFIIEHLLSFATELTQLYSQFYSIIHNNLRMNNELGEKIVKSPISAKLIDWFGIFSSSRMTTNRIFTFIESSEPNHGLVANVDSVTLEIKSSKAVRSASESLTILSNFNSIALSLPKISSAVFHLADDRIYDDFMTHLILRPWTVNVVLSFVYNRWNVSQSIPWKRIKIDSEYISCCVNPAQVEKFIKIIRYYNRFVQKIRPNIRNCVVKNDEINVNINEEFYKDDLRTGAFQYVKIETDKCNLPSPYEVFFCNRRFQPFMCWRYPQPRKLTKLQIYPILVEDFNDEFVEKKIRCQLQYYNEMSDSFDLYVSFNLCETSIQNILLPQENPRIIAAECWRIILLDFIDDYENNDIKMDIRSLVGYVRVDSVYHSSLIAAIQCLVNINEVQVQFSTLSPSENLFIDDFCIMNYIPQEQNFLKLTFSDIKIAWSSYEFAGTNVLKFGGIGRASILNFEYLMLESFVEPFKIEIMLYCEKGCPNKFVAKLEMFHMKISPHVVHTLSIANVLWKSKYSKNSDSLCRISSVYVICNSTNVSIAVQQKDIRSAVINLIPSTCQLFSWANAASAKVLIMNVHMLNKKFTSVPFYINKTGTESVICKSHDDETYWLNISVSVIEHSSVIRQVVIRGSLSAYNLTQCRLEMCIISHGKENNKNKLYSPQIISISALPQNRLQSIILPLGYKLSFKIRFSSSQNEIESGAWSGLVSLKIPLSQSNQTSWMIKIPLRGSKEHFRSIWCQITWETVDGFPVYLIAFRPQCWVTSYFPSNCHVQIFNDLGLNMNLFSVPGQGMKTDLSVPDTVSLDKYIIQYMQSEEKQDSDMKVTLEPTHLVKTESDAQEYHIENLINEIDLQIEEENRWPFMNDELKNVKWKVNQVFQVEPIIKVLRNEERGCGTKIELYPPLILANTLLIPILLTKTSLILTVDSYEIVAPPIIEETFKLGLVDKNNHYMSGSLQLCDDQTFRIPRVSGRIPMNGFITTTIDCKNYVSFVNINSSNHKEMRLISVHCSYIISNNSEFDVGCSAWAVCRSGTKIPKPFDIPDTFDSKSIFLAGKNSAFVGQPIMKWYKIGLGDVQVLPYLILTVGDHIACPIRICDLSEKQRYPIIFSRKKLVSKELINNTAPCIFMTAQQHDGRIFLTIWTDSSPYMCIHNESELPLNVTSSKSSNVPRNVTHNVDWNWNFCVHSKYSTYYHPTRQVQEMDEREPTLDYLMFSVENEKQSKTTRWSAPVALIPCSNQLITLPLSQRHIKLAIFKNGFTFVVWIESATMDELSAKVIRARLSESFLPLNESAVIPLIDEKPNMSTEDRLERPSELYRRYSNGLAESFSAIIIVEKIGFTLTCKDESNGEETDIATLWAKNVNCNLHPVLKLNEVAQEIQCNLSIESYQLDNDQYCLRAFDFPVVLLSQIKDDEITESNLSHHLEDVLLNQWKTRSPAFELNICFKPTLKFNSMNIRDVQILLAATNVYLEDKYITKLKYAFGKLFSATTDGKLFKSISNLSTMTITQSATAELKNYEVQEESNEVTEELDIDTDEKIVTKEKYDADAYLTTKAFSSSSNKSIVISDCDNDEKSPDTLVIRTENLDNTGNGLEDQLAGLVVNDEFIEKLVDDSSEENALQDGFMNIIFPQDVAQRSQILASPLRLRNLSISAMQLTVSLRTSTTFYIALDRSPLNFSEFKKEYLVTTPFELGNILVVHYFFGAIYGTGWAISSLEFVGSPGVLARNLGTGMKDFLSMPIYGISRGPQGFVLGVAHGSASLMKHIMAGTLSSVTNFASSWARTLNRFTLDADDLLQSEQIRRFPPSNVAEGVLQGLAEFGISILGGISGIAHHPLQYATSSNNSRSLFNSISLGIVGVLTRPLSGAAELVARTGQGIMSHVGWSAIPSIQNGSLSLKSLPVLEISELKYLWNRKYGQVLMTVEAVNAEDVSRALCIILTSSYLHIDEINEGLLEHSFHIQSHEFCVSDNDPTLIIIQKKLCPHDTAEDFTQTRIFKFVNDTNQAFDITHAHSEENSVYINKMDVVYMFSVNPQIRNFLLQMIVFIKNLPKS